MTPHVPAPSARTAVPVRWALVVVLSVAYVALVGAEALFLRVAGYEAFEADGPSMEPTLVNSDRFVVDKGAYGLTLPFATEQAAHWADPVPGDVVVLRSPADEIDILKRVIGVAGDRIEIRDDVIYRNGEPIATGAPTPCESNSDGEELVCTEERVGDRRWLTSRSAVPAPESMAELVVPEGTVFVLGDHRDRSNDSRNPRIGSVPVARVRGNAIAIYWSGVAGRAGTWIE